MLKINFLCHGNICRSPMAEFVMKELVRQAGLSDSIQITSAATSAEEIGSDMHPKTRAKLFKEKIPFTSRRAVQFTRDCYEKHDYIIAMDKENIYRLRHIIGEDRDKKVHLLLSFTGSEQEVADPWYTGDFDKTYKDISMGCKALLKSITENKA